MEKQISFFATLSRVSSNSLGGFKVTLDIPDTDAKAAATLMSEFRDQVLSVAIVSTPEK